MRLGEGYRPPAHGLTDPACPVTHALRNQYLLQLDQILTGLFITSLLTLELCRRLLETEEPADPLPSALRRLLTGIARLALNPCEKGRFFDAMNSKLDQLSRGRSNEITTVDFAQIAASLSGQ